MNARDLAAAPAPPHPTLRLLMAREPTSPWSARALDEPVPPATLGDARTRRDELRDLLARERDAAADFLLALADFDRRRGWERLGHASLFAFLTRELGLSAGAAQLRLSAARLLPRHPEVEAALRSGRLCISAVGQVARVLTVENESRVLPRFLGLSAREATEVAASILPRVEPPRREVVTSLAPTEQLRAAAQGERFVGAGLPRAAPGGGVGSGVERGGAASTPPGLVEAAGPAHASVQGSAVESAPGAPSLAAAVPLHTCEVLAPARVAPRTPTVEPLTGELRRLHLTVSKGFLDKVATARTGLSHALPGASNEQVLEAALDLLLARQAQRKGLGKRTVRRAKAAWPLTLPPVPKQEHISAKSAAHAERSAEGAESMEASPPHRPHVPAAIEREVRLRDGDRCQFPLDAGGVCGSTWQVELDHVVPLALGGATTPANLRCACRFHNQAAAEEALGVTVMHSSRLRGARKRPAR